LTLADFKARPRQEAPPGVRPSRASKRRLMADLGDRRPWTAANRASSRGVSGRWIGRMPGRANLRSHRVPSIFRAPCSRRWMTRGLSGRRPTGKATAGSREGFALHDAWARTQVAASCSITAFQLSPATMSAYQENAMRTSDTLPRQRTRSTRCASYVPLAASIAGSIRCSRGGRNCHDGAASRSWPTRVRMRFYARSNGDIIAIATFPSRPSRTTDSVPTSVALGPDGAYLWASLPASRSQRVLPTSIGSCQARFRQFICAD